MTAARNAVGKWSPKDADRLLRDPKLLIHACDYRSNPAFCHADQRTEAFRGERMVDVAPTKTPIEWAAEIAEWLYLPLDEFKAAFARRSPRSRSRTSGSALPQAMRTNPRGGARSRRPGGS